MWLHASGLEKIYELTNTPTQYELRFDLGLGSERAYAVYDKFKIAPVKQKFTLTIGKYRGTAGGFHTNRGFYVRTKIVKAVEAALKQKQH